MTSDQATKLVRPHASDVVTSAVLQAAWQRRRKWSRTDTARHLNDRAAPLIALFRRLHPQAAPRHSRQFGYWLKDNTPALFDRAHEKLAGAADDAARERLLPTDLLA